MMINKFGTVVTAMFVFMAGAKAMEEKSSTEYIDGVSTYMTQELQKLEAIDPDPILYWIINQSDQDMAFFICYYPMYGVFYCESCIKNIINNKTIFCLRESDLNNFHQCFLRSLENARYYSPEIKFLPKNSEIQTPLRSHAYHFVIGRKHPYGEPYSSEQPGSPLPFGTCFVIDPNLSQNVCTLPFNDFYEKWIKYIFINDDSSPFIHLPQELRWKIALTCLGI